MATATTPGPTLGGGRKHVLRRLVVPVGAGAVAVAVSGYFHHPVIGALLTVGLLLGAVNGLMAEAAAAKITPDANPTRATIVGASMRRLGVVTIVALAIAFLAQPYGWANLLGLAFYQLLSLATALGQAAREVREA